MTARPEGARTNPLAPTLPVLRRMGPTCRACRPSGMSRRRNTRLPREVTVSTRPFRRPQAASRVIEGSPTRVELRGTGCPERQEACGARGSPDDAPVRGQARRVELESKRARGSVEESLELDALGNDVGGRKHGGYDRALVFVRVETSVYRSTMARKLAEEFSGKERGSGAGARGGGLGATPHAR